MKITFITDRPDCWLHGIWYHRIKTPSDALGMRGHTTKWVSIGSDFKEEQLEWPDVVVFGRTYPNEYDPVKWMKEFKKRGARVVYDMDDDFWAVAKDNPSVLVSNALKDQYEGMIREADVLITPSTVLAKKFKKFKKPVFIAPNGVSEDYVPRSGHDANNLVIGYMGAASHWKDLQIIAPVLTELHKKYDFTFGIYGLVGEPLEATMYYYNKYYRSGLYPEKVPYYRSALEFYEKLNGLKMYHIPFMPPELHPTVLSRADFDIGLAPLEDTEFNSGKSCIKFYEYAASGTVVLSSDVMPYKDEVNYRAKNTEKDWYNKLEKLITDPEFREKTRQQQANWVKEHRSLEAIGLDWELALQRPGGLPVLNQQRA